MAEIEWSRVVHLGKSLLQVRGGDVVLTGPPDHRERGGSDVDDGRDRVLPAHAVAVEGLNPDIEIPNVRDPRGVYGRGDTGALEGVGVDVVQP